jgi:hypothetical protein
LYCKVRKEWVAALPEEIIRQRILNYMISQLECPAALVSVECALRSFPHLNAAERAVVPNRRADIVCFAKDTVSKQLYPLLVVECKAIKLTSRVINQVLGYNHFMRARFIAIANHTEFRLGWFDVQQDKYAFIDFLPAYHALISFSSQ